MKKMTFPLSMMAGLAGLLLLIAFTLFYQKARNVTDATKAEVTLYDITYYGGTPVHAEELIRTNLGQENRDIVLRTLSAMQATQPSNCYFHDIMVSVYKDNKIYKYYVSSDGDPEIRINDPEKGKQYSVEAEEFKIFWDIIIDSLFQGEYDSLFDYFSSQQVPRSEPDVPSYHSPTSSITLDP